VKAERKNEFNTAREKCVGDYLGKGKLNDMWYLKILAVHPKFQRHGVGGALIDRGLKYAQKRGEKVYLEASEVGRGLYLKKGFRDVGDHG
jgi:GNAT superfamily N-acetyltransferase